MTFLVERLAELRRQLDHLRLIRPRVTSAAVLASDLTVHNDVLFSLLVIVQAIIDIAGELASRRGIRFQDYTEAIRALQHVPGFPPDLVSRLERLPGFRNVLVHEYVTIDYDRVIAALGDLDLVDAFIDAVSAIEKVE